MEHSILQEATPKNLQAYLDGKAYPRLYYPDIFPVKYTGDLKFETIIGSRGNRVAADVVAYDTSAPEKTRKVVKSITGSIPPIRISRSMRETDLNNYNILRNMNAGNSSMNALLDLVFGDIDFCVEGVNARLEWLAIRALAGGTITLNTTNNGGGIVTETTIDFQLPTANKEVEADANHYWTTGAYASNAPITDIETIMAEAKTKGVTIKHIVMNLSKFIAFSTSTQVKNYCSAAYISGAWVSLTPTFDQVNTMLRSRNLPDIVIIDTSIDIENKEHSITAYDPWLDAAGADRYVLFCPEFPLGNMMVGPIAAETHPAKQAVQVKRGHILVQKYSEVNPTTEWTMAETNAFPSWPTIDQCYILDSESHTTYGA